MKITSPRSSSASDAARQSCLTSAVMPAQPNQSLIDGLRVLQTLVSHGQSVGSRDMAAILGMEPTRANRLLGTLAAVGLAEQGTDRKYRPGPGVHVLAAQSLQGSHLLSCALPHLEALREENLAPDLVVALGVLWQRQVCYLFHARPRMALSQAIGTHELEPAGNSSIGVILLAQTGVGEEVALAEAELSGISKPPLPSLSESVAHARREGFGRLDFRQGEVSLAVAIGEPVIAGLAVSAKFEAAQIPVALARLQETAALIAREMARKS